MNNIVSIVLVSMTACISLVMGLYMLFLHKSTRAKGTAYWAAGSLLTTLGVIAMAVPPRGGFTSTVISNIIVAIALYIYLAGIWNFKEKDIKKRILLGFPILDIILSIFFFQFYPSHKIRLIAHLIIVGVYCILAIYEMLKLNPQQNYLKNIFRVNAIAYLAFLIIQITRIILITCSANFIQLQMNIGSIVMFFIINLLMLALTFGFLTAVNLQLHNKLQMQLKARSKLFAIIAHDLRNPIGTIMNFLELLNNEPDLNEEERKKCLKETEALSKSTTHLLQNLFEWATSSINLAKAQNENIDLSELVSSNLDYFKSMARLKSIHIELMLENNSLINGNRKMIETVLRNLVSNATKYTPGGGKVLLSTEKSKQKVRLAVADTGIGIEPERLNTILQFEMSESTKGTSGETGSGFGLALSNEFVKQNNGILNLESKPNVGTKVIAEFPLAQEE